ncbi:MAG: FtsX-like permease family protein, partial [Cyclobacteriaceae bacterium]
NQFYTYLLLKDDASPTVVSNKFRDLLPSYLETEDAASYIPHLQLLPTIHLESNLFREIEANSDITYLYVFGAIGVLILIISSINFINLTTARALTRMKEVGIRKTSGAVRSQLVMQYLSEALIISYISLALGLLLFYLFLPSFNTLTGKTFSLYGSSNNLFYSLAFLAATLVGLISGSYPALYLARQKPSEVLKGKTKTSSSNTTRKALVIVQFAISAFLIISAAIIFQQLSYIQSKKLGFNPSELITIPIQEDVMRVKAETIKNELLAQPEVENVTVSGGQPGGNDWGIPLEIEGVDTDQIPPMRVLAVGHDFINTFQMEILTGRDFSKDFASDSIAYIVNEEAARQMGWQNPLEHRIGMPAVGRPLGAVIGVIKDFHFRSLKEKIAPVVLFIPPASWSSYYTIRIKTDEMQAGLNAVEKVWARFDTSHPFSYTFFDETYGRLYTAEKRLGTLVAYFTLIGIFISCLGLFSLSSFMTAQRTKEIGIRKVMGASVKSITLMLTKELILLVALGFVVAAPAGYYIMQQWLGDFAYRTSIRPEIFAATALVTLAIAIITVSFRVIRAGSKNPVEALRTE